jgi:hypothetical protein
VEEDFEDRQGPHRPLEPIIIDDNDDDLPAFSWKD